MICGYQRAASSAARSSAALAPTYSGAWRAPVPQCSRCARGC
nr:MAG TPA: hypothetical protein [Caudoviricetes sp.]